MGVRKTRASRAKQNGKVRRVRIRTWDSADWYNHRIETYEGRLNTGSDMKELRTRNQVSQAALAEHLGCSTSRICQLECGGQNWNAVVRAEYIAAIRELKGVSE